MKTEYPKDVLIISTPALSANSAAATQLSSSMTNSVAPSSERNNQKFAFALSTSSSFNLILLPCFNSILLAPTATSHHQVPILSGLQWNSVSESHFPWCIARPSDANEKTKKNKNQGLFIQCYLFKEIDNFPTVLKNQ